MTDAGSEGPVESGIQKAIYDIVSNIPSSDRPMARDPESESRRLISSAQSKAALIAGSLSLPPGPLGMLTIIPDLILIWKVQSKLVADIAAVHGKTAFLRRESMLACLFKHGMASLGRDLLARVGQRVLIRRASLRVLQTLLGKIGVRVTQRVISRGISRWIPLLGAAVIAGYAWYDTGKVGESALELFSEPLDLEETETE
jgi:hypothetical protein